MDWHGQSRSDGHFGRPSAVGDGHGPRRCNGLLRGHDALALPCQLQQLGFLRLALGDVLLDCNEMCDVPARPGVNGGDGHFFVVQMPVFPPVDQLSPPYFAREDGAPDVLVEDSIMFDRI